MTARIIRSHPKSGTVSRIRLRAAARRVAKAAKPSSRKGAPGTTTTASGRGQIAFRINKPGLRAVA